MTTKTSQWARSLAGIDGVSPGPDVPALTGLRAGLVRSGLYWRTIAHLRPEQLVHRVRLRGQRLAMQRQPNLVRRAWRPRSLTAGSWPGTFAPIDARLDQAAPSANDNADGRFSFLGHLQDLGRPICWQPAEVPLLWQYNLHYWEWGWALVIEPDRKWARDTYSGLWQSWADSCPFGSWPAWAPYPVSLRAWAWCGHHAALVAGRPEEERFCVLLGDHAAFLRHNLEYDVGGNHLVKNLKGLLGLAVFFDDQRLIAEVVERVEAQLRIQVLPDGGHYELSPSYHCQVLGDLLDMRDLLVSARRLEPCFQRSILAMQRWLGAMLTSAHQLAQMNDSWEVSTDTIALLAPSLDRQPRAVALASSGYVVLRNGRAQCTFDVGEPCPPDLPAHAQADCLSFELAIDGKRVVVDPGTTTYEGPQRSWERSTAAHNTVTVDGQDQTEVWGHFRAGRLAPAHLDLVKGGDTPEASAHHTGYVGRKGAPVHRRTVRLFPDALEVTDELLGSGRHTVSMAIEHTDLPDGRPLTIEGPEVLRVMTALRGGRHRTVAHGELDLPARWMTTLRF